MREINLIELYSLIQGKYLLVEWLLCTKSGHSKIKGKVIELHLGVLTTENTPSGSQIT